MKLEVDIPTTGLPEDMELAAVAYRLPTAGEYYFISKWVRCDWTHSTHGHLVAILKPKEIWLPCTPEDAFAEMLHSGSRQIRTRDNKTRVLAVVSCNRRGMKITLAGYVPSDFVFDYGMFEVLKTKEKSK